jgi:hypothetical protein
VRSIPSGAWIPRPGKPGGRQRISDIVIPIIPDQAWQHLTANRGYVAYKDYIIRYRRIAALVALLARDGKVLKRDLHKAANREKLFAPRWF